MSFKLPRSIYIVEGRKLFLFVLWFSLTTRRAIKPGALPRFLACFLFLSPMQTDRQSEIAVVGVSLTTYMLASSVSDAN